MLNEVATEQIRHLGYASLHDVWFHALYLGEPFLQDGVIAYFDGRAITLVGQALRDLPTPTQTLLRGLAVDWVRRGGAETVEYIGPEPVNFDCLRKLGFGRTSSVARTSVSAELSIDCASGAEAFAHRLYRRALAERFSARQRKVDFLTAQHFSLIERLYRGQERTGYLAATAVAWPAALRLPDVTLIEAWSDDHMAGFVALHHAFNDIGVGLFMAHEALPGVADFLYAHMLTYGHTTGLKSINVDSSPTRGHLRFKQKWHGRLAVPPYYFTRWSRGRMARRTHTGWGARLMGRSAV